MKVQRGADGKIRLSANHKAIQPHQSGVCCRCGAPTGGNQLCGDCQPCTFTVSFSGITYASHCDEGFKIVGALAGPYTLYRVSDCLYRLMWPTQSLLSSADDPDIRYQEYASSDCIGELSALPGWQIELDFTQNAYGPGGMPRLLVLSVPYAHTDHDLEPHTPISYVYFAGVATPTCDNEYIIHNEITHELQPPSWTTSRWYSQAYGGQAQIIRQGDDCQRSELVYASNVPGELADMGDLAAGTYALTYSLGAIRYDDESSSSGSLASGSHTLGDWYVNRDASRKYVVVDSGGTIISDAPGETDGYADWTYAEMFVGGDTLTFSHAGGHLYLRLDDLSNPVAHDAGPLSDHAPVFCLCIPDQTCVPAFCAPTCWSLEAQTGDSGTRWLSLPAGDYDIYLASGGIQFDGLSDQFRVNHFDDGNRGFRVMHGEPQKCTTTDVTVPCPAPTETLYAHAPGSNTGYPTLADCEANEVGTLITVTHIGGLLGLKFIDSTEGTYGGYGGSAPVYTVCLAEEIPPQSDSSSQSMSSQSSQSMSSDSSSSASCVFCLWNGNYDCDTDTWTISRNTCTTTSTNPFGFPVGEWTFDPEFIPQCVAKFVTQHCLGSNDLIAPDPPVSPPTECTDCSVCCETIVVVTTGCGGGTRSMTLGGFIDCNWLGTSVQIFLDVPNDQWVLRWTITDTSCGDANCYYEWSSSRGDNHDCACPSLNAGVWAFRATTCSAGDEAMSLISFECSDPP